MNRLKLLREERGLFQKDIASLLSVSIPAVNQYESGKRDMSTETVVKLAEYFGVSTDYLLGKSNIRNPEKTDLDNLQIGLSTKDYTNISDEQIKQIEDFAKYVLKDNKKDKEEK